MAHTSAEGMATAVAVAVVAVAGSSCPRGRTLFDGSSTGAAARDPQRVGGRGAGLLVRDADRGAPVLAVVEVASIVCSGAGPVAIPVQER